MRLTVEFDREEDGRWIAEIPKLPDVMVYGRDCRQALDRAEALARWTLTATVERRVPLARRRERGQG